jgi:hypothetical protein
VTTISLVKKKSRMTTNARVHKHREKLRGEQCRRLEVWIGEGVIDNIRHLATVTNRSTWDVVQEALKAYVARHPTAPVKSANSSS